MLTFWGVAVASMSPSSSLFTFDLSLPLVDDRVPREDPLAAAFGGILALLQFVLGPRWERVMFLCLGMMVKTVYDAIETGKCECGTEGR
jgi:hypothetical protein